jgi:beta-lactamase regulating signal transducer with metallopeptidase domain
MNHYIIFFLKSVISSAVLFGYYSFALRNKKFHQYNRFYLLATLMISIVLPFSHLTLFRFHQEIVNNLTGFSYKAVSAGTHEMPPAFDWFNILSAISISVTLIMFLMLLKKIAWIYRLKYRHTVIKMQGFDLIETNVKQAPFSFLNNLFWRPNISRYEKNGAKIFKHEMTHIKEKHTYDKLFSQVVLCLFWVNPFYWFIQKELNMVHEFIADSKSIQQGDTQSFAEMLLQSHNEGRYLNPSHSFFNSSIKRRIIMLATSKNARYSYLRRVCALPILLLVIFLASFKMVNAQTDPKLNPNTSVKVDKLSIHPINDSVANVAISYVDAKGKPALLNMVAGYSKNDSNKKNTVHDEESGERRDVSLAETKEIVKQIIQNPPREDVYFVDGKEYSPGEIRKLDPDKIRTINVYNRNEALKRFGDKAKNGAIVFTTK